MDGAGSEAERPRAKSLSRAWAAVSTIAFGLTFAGFLTLNIDGPTIVLAIVAPFVGVLTGIAAVIVAYRRRESGRGARSCSTSSRPVSGSW